MQWGKGVCAQKAAAPAAQHPLVTVSDVVVGVNVADVDGYLIKRGYNYSTRGYSCSKRGLSCSECGSAFDRCNLAEGVGPIDEHAAIAGGGGSANVLHWHYHGGYRGDVGDLERKCDIPAEGGGRGG